MKRYLCIHGHFYQPPRENPWLEFVEREASAQPAHDWNERILEECYAPNTAATLLDEHQKIKGFLNNYEWINFNFGPTLIHWMERHFPNVVRALIDADQKSVYRLEGHGNAIAQIYNHLIMPLASPRDKITQIQWGIADFERLFGRFPEGMWLSETAVDTPSLEALAEQGIRYSICSPRQAKAVRQSTASSWRDVNEHTLETGRAYRCVLPSGREIALFFYDGGLAHHVAFGDSLKDPKGWLSNVKRALWECPEEAPLIHWATDGESYGHHARGGEVALASLLHAIQPFEDVKICNYGWFLEHHPAQWEVQIHEQSSWSCMHGIERWRSGKGYTHDKWSYEWRRSLRDGLNALKQRLDALYEREAIFLVKDPWALRDQASDFLTQRDLDQAKVVLEEHCHEQHKDDQSLHKIMTLLEMQHQAMLMFTSCGWFFDDISNLETQIILRHAWQAICLADRFCPSEPLEQHLIDFLKQASSNYPQWRDGEKVWYELVRTRLVDKHDIWCGALALQLLGKSIQNDARALHETPTVSLYPPSVLCFNAYTWSLRAHVVEVRRREDRILFWGHLHATSRSTKEVRECGFCVYAWRNEIASWFCDVEETRPYHDFDRRFTSFLKGHEHINVLDLYAFFEQLPRTVTDWMSHERESYQKHQESVHADAFAQALQHSTKQSRNWLEQKFWHSHHHGIPLEGTFRTGVAWLQFQDVLDCLHLESLSVAGTSLVKLWPSCWIEPTQRETLYHLWKKMFLSCLKHTRVVDVLEQQMRGLQAIANWLGQGLAEQWGAEGLSQAWRTGGPWLSF
ncbi:MAG: DUF3536 domain-containing protein, partial [Myxococcota bacterium]